MLAQPKPLDKISIKVTTEQQQYSGKQFNSNRLDGEHVYACNIYDEGFDRDDKIKKKPISKDHKEIDIHINKDMDKKEAIELNDKSIDASF